MAVKRIAYICLEYWNFFCDNFSVKFQHVWIPFNLAYNKDKLYKTLDYWSIDMLNFDFLEKGLGIVAPPYFVNNFSRKMFLMLYSINWPNVIVWWPLLFEILDNMRIAIVCFPGCDVLNFEINPIFLIKPFYYLTKMLRQKFKYLENKKSFWGEIKSNFHHF